ncbi:hypothetical protein cypCar_00027055 [Cyprinus carpio]|nr:hypothetical protein cypCar_00027055 [Cyprinus carpio]
MLSVKTLSETFEEECWISVVCCLLLACVYDGSLYVWRGNLPRCQVHHCGHCWAFIFFPAALLPLTLTMMGFPAIGLVLQHPQRPVLLLSYQLGVLLFLILLFPFTDPAFYGMTPICSQLLTPRSACAMTHLHGAWIKMYLKVFKKYDWGKSMKDSK